MLTVVAVARVHPTEDRDKVRQALLNIFPRAEVSETAEGLTAETDDLSRFKELLRNHRILDSARAVLLRGMEGDCTAFTLNKQAAAVGKISFVESRPPLGPIEVTVTSDGLEALIDEVAPRTVDGEIP